VLGDIPAIGGLFRNKDRRNSKVELLIFVTPKILVESK
ncbi:MAG: hypothetical protein Q8N51_06175, partial [Gammaproteobacteria bacterium]|nr:hypothetical protein [Gammaproteobacteria bacterium]